MFEGVVATEPLFAPAGSVDEASDVSPAVPAVESLLTGVSGVSEGGTSELSSGGGGSEYELLPIDMNKITWAGLQQRFGLIDELSDFLAFLVSELQMLQLLFRVERTEI